jgi:hypothetical protein
MAAAAIAAKAAINRKIAKQKAAQLAADLAAGLDPEEEFMKRVMKRMEEEKKAKLTKWQDPTQWTVSALHAVCCYCIVLHLPAWAQFCPTQRCPALH